MAIILRLDRVMADRKISLGELAGRVGIANVNLSRMKTAASAPSAFRRSTPSAGPLRCQPGDILEYVEDETEPFPRPNV